MITIGQIRRPIGNYRDVGIARWPIGYPGGNRLSWLRRYDRTYWLLAGLNRLRGLHGLIRLRGLNRLVWLHWLVRLHRLCRLIRLDRLPRLAWLSRLTRLAWLHLCLSRH